MQLGILQEVAFGRAATESEVEVINSSASKGFEEAFNDGASKEFIETVDKAFKQDTGQSEVLNAITEKIAKDNALMAKSSTPFDGIMDANPEIARRPTLVDKSTYDMAVSATYSTLPNKSVIGFDTYTTDKDRQRSGAGIDNIWGITNEVTQRYIIKNQ